MKFYLQKLKHYCVLTNMNNNVPNNWITHAIEKLQD